MDSSSDNPTSISPLYVVPVVGVYQAPTTVSATEACTLSAGRPISAPVSGLIPAQKQHGSVSGRGLETPPTRVSLAAHSPLSSSHDAMMQISESGKNLSIQDSGSDLFPNAQNIFITDGTFVVNNILPARERHMKIPVLQKPNSSSLFVGRKDVLNKLRKIFVHSADSKLTRRSCLLWGTGGIGRLRFASNL